MGVSSEPRRLKMPRKGITRKEHTSELQSHDNLVCRFLEFRRVLDRKSTRLNSSHTIISYAVFCLKKKINDHVFECPRMSQVALRDGCDVEDSASTTGEYAGLERIAFQHFLHERGVELFEESQPCF